MSHRQFTYGPATVWSYGTTEIYHPLSPVLETMDVQLVRIGLEMSQATGSQGDITVTPAFDVSDDGVNWTTSASTILPSGAVVSCDDNEVVYDNEFVDITSVTNGTDTKRYMRFGVKVVHDTDYTLGICRVSLQVDIRHG